jgi:hypothetical protein
MHKAYDTFLQSEVSADLAVKNGGGLEPYRYECAHCGEEVRLAAVGSTIMVSHFRHRSGNNDVKCEDYLGQYGTISTDSRSRKSKNERAEFYFDKSTMMFYLGLRFSDDEINAYEQLSTIFELRSSPQEQAFFTIKINNNNFYPDNSRMIPIEKFSYNYFLSNTLNGVKRKYEVFNNNTSTGPTFFKIQGNDDNGYKAKLVRSATLYTNIPYFVVFQNQYSTPNASYLSNDIRIDGTFRFETMGKKFLGMVLTVKTKTAYLDSLTISWGYHLESSETLTLLWPPATLVDETVLIGSKHAYLYSSFELQAHGNINVHSDDIKRIANGLSKVSVKTKTKVYKKNAEIVIDKNIQRPVNFDALPYANRLEGVYTVPDDGTHFLFNLSGVMSLSKGQSIPLTPYSVIRLYLFGYLTGSIHPLQQNELTGEQLLKDLLAHYKRTEAFPKGAFHSYKLSETASHYVQKCEALGLINSAAKRFIEEGRL